MATAVRPTAEATAAPPPQQQEAGDALISIRPFLLEIPVQGVQPKGGKKGAHPPAGAVPLPAKLDTFQDKPAVHSYVQLLCKGREVALAALGSDSATALEVNNAVADYMSLLLCLTPSAAAVVANQSAPAPVPSSSAAAAAAAPSAPGQSSSEAELAPPQPLYSEKPLDKPVSGGQKALTPAPSAAQTALNNAIEFQWVDLFPATPPSKNSGPPPAAGGALFESASVLLAHALSKAHAAALIANRSPEGVPSVKTSEIYRLLREAAGIASALQADPFLAAATRSGAADLRPSLLAALEGLWLADAESLTVARALAKGTSSSLVAAVAADCCGLYRAVAEKCPPAGQWGDKLVGYARFKAAAISAYAHIANAQHLLAEDLAGEAMRSAREATDLLAASAAAVEAFDRLPPKGSEGDHAAFRAHVRTTVERAADRIRRINGMVHYKAEAAELPPLPEPSRLVQQQPLELPQVSPEAAAVEEAFKAAASAGEVTTAEGNGAAAASSGQGGKQQQAAQPEEDKPPKKGSGGCCCVIS